MAKKKSFPGKEEIVEVEDFKCEGDPKLINEDQLVIDVEGPTVKELQQQLKEKDIQIQLLTDGNKAMSDEIESLKTKLNGAPKSGKKPKVRSNEVKLDPVLAEAKDVIGEVTRELGVDRAYSVFTMAGYPNAKSLKDIPKDELENVIKIGNGLL